MPIPNHLENQSFIQRRVLWIVSAVFVLSLSAYFAQFHGPFSKDQGTWGQFGDFLGGVANPILGFCTVWLLTVSLRQTQISLLQAYEELKLAKDALEATRVAQIATEDTLKKQILLAQKSHDMNNTLALWSGLTREANNLRELIKNKASSYYGGPENDPTLPFQVALNRISAQIHLLDQIKDREISRLVENQNTNE